MVTPELLDFLRAQLATGMSREEVERLLVEQGGWDKLDVEEGLREISPSLASPQIAAPVATAILKEVPIEKIEPEKSVLVEIAKPEPQAPIVVSAPTSLPQIVTAAPEIKSTPEVKVEPKAVVVSSAPPVLPQTTVASEIKPTLEVMPEGPTVLAVRSERPKTETEDFLGIFNNHGGQTSVAESSLPKVVVTTGQPEQKATNLEILPNEAVEVISNLKQQEAVLTINNSPEKAEQVSSTKIESQPISPKPPLFVFDLEQAKKEDTVIMATPDNPTGKPVLAQVISSKTPDVEQVSGKKIETQSVAELWLTQGKVTPQPERNEAKEQALRSSIQSRRTMASDMLLRGRGTQIKGLPAILPQEEANPMPQFSSSPPVVSVQTQEKIAVKKPELSQAEIITRKNKVKKTIGIVLGILILLLVIVGAAVFLLGMRGPDAATLLSQVMSKFYAVSSLSYNGSASSNLTLTSTANGITRNGLAKFSLTYSGDLINDKNGFGNGNHNVKWTGGLQSGDFAWNTDVTSDMRMYGGDLFFHVLSFPQEADIDPDIFKTYWVKVDIAEIAKELTLEGVSTAVQNYGGIAGGQSTSFNALLAKNMPFVGGSKVGSETIDGVPVTRYKLTSDPEKMYTFANDLYAKFIGKNFAMTDDEKVKFKQALSKLTLDVWVNEKSSMLIQIALSGDLDDDIGAVHVKGPLSLSFTFTRFEDPLVVTEPAPFLTLNELHARMNDYKKFKELRAKNDAKVNGATEIAHALTTYINQKGRFPTTLSELREDNVLATSTMSENVLKEYFYFSYVKADNFAKTNRCIAKSKTCIAYHLGINLDDLNNPALVGDADVIADIHGGDTTGCAIERELACYDVVFSVPSAASTTAPSI